MKWILVSVKDINYFKKLENYYWFETRPEFRIPFHPEFLCSTVPHIENLKK